MFIVLSGAKLPPWSTLIRVHKLLISVYYWHSDSSSDRLSSVLVAIRHCVLMLSHRPRFRIHPLSQPRATSRVTFVSFPLPCGRDSRTSLNGGMIQRYDTNQVSVEITVYQCYLLCLPLTTFLSVRGALRPMASLHVLDPSSVF